MDTPISLVISTGTTAYDVSNLVSEVKWSGRKGSAARSLTVTMIDDDGYNHDRMSIPSLLSGYRVVFKYNKTTLFQGLLMTVKQASTKKMTITAYDNAIYLANNKDTFTYKNATASGIFKNVCNRFGLSTGTVDLCSYKIPELIKSKTSAWDVLQDALSSDFDATGVRHYIYCEGTKISLIERRKHVTQWVIQPGSNLQDYSYTRSIEDVRTRVKMVTSEGNSLATKASSKLENAIGMFQEIQQPDDDLTTSQLNKLISSVLSDLTTPDRDLDVTALGKPDVIAGGAVYIIIPHLGLNRAFYVDSDTHTFSKHSHMMNLSLSWCTDFTK